MSAGYASRLKEYPNKGKVGLPEFKETTRSLKQKLEQLTTMVQSSKYIVVLTGAGISTSAGIPDFRGPKGIWTLEKKKSQAKNKKKQQQGKRQNGFKRQKTLEDDNNDDNKNEEENNNIDKKNGTMESTDNDKNEAAAIMDFSKAQPTLTHRAITKLVDMGKIQYCITQNVDGLHRRSGLSRKYHCALHGCAFTEQCRDCGMEYFRNVDVGGMSFQPTGRYCDEPDCCDDNTTTTNDNNSEDRKGVLVDTLLDWMDELPHSDFKRAQEECDKADLVLCLGTSLRIDPAGLLPLRAKKFVIVNYQKTAKDEHASLLLHASVDDVMDHVMKQLLGEGKAKIWKEEEPAPPIERKWRAIPRRLDHSDSEEEDEK